MIFPVLVSLCRIDPLVHFIALSYDRVAFYKPSKKSFKNLNILQSSQSVEYAPVAQASVEQLSSNNYSRSRGFESHDIQFVSFFPPLYHFFSSQCIFEDIADLAEKTFQGNIASTLSDMLTFYQ